MKANNNRHRVELWFTAIESNDIMRYLCLKKEKRKTACERIIRSMLHKQKAKQHELIK